MEDSEDSSPRFKVKELSFFSKIKGAILLSRKSFFESYRSSKLWQGYFVFIICIGLFSFVLSTSGYPLFMEIFSHYTFSFTLLGITISISISPLFFILSFMGICIFLLLLSFLISYFKRLQIKRIMSSLGFATTPLVILVFYLGNKFILQSYKYELGPILIGISLGWSLLSGLIGLARLIGFEFTGLFNYAIKSLIFRKKRTYAAIIGIAVAVGLIVTPIPILSGYYTQLNSLAGSDQYAEYIILMEKGKSNYFSSYIDSTTLSSLNHFNIQSISPETYLNVDMYLNSSTFQVNLRGINYSLFYNFRSTLSFQKLPSYVFSDEQIMIGNYLASLLNISYLDLPINITLTYGLKSHNVTLIGLVKSYMYYDLEIIAPINLTRILKSELMNKYSLIEVKLVDPSLMDATIQALQEMNPNLDVNRENQMADFVNGLITRTIQSIWLLSIIIYIVMAFGMFHVMHTIVRESEREITIIKSIGSSRSQILRIFLYQAFMICLVGSILGVLGGIFLSYAASFLVSSITALAVSPVFDISIICIAISIGLICGILGSLYPAYTASKMSVGERIK